MRKLALILALLCLSIATHAQLVTATFTITNTAGTTNGMTLTINGSTRTFTNLENCFFISTGTNIGQATTNIYTSYTHCPQSPVSVFALSSSNIIQFQAVGSLTVTPSAGIGTVTNTSQGTNSGYPVQVPYGNYGTTEGQMIYSGVIEGINNRGTNQIQLNRLTNIVVDTLSIQSISGTKTFTGGLTVSTILSVPSSVNTSTIQNLNVGKLGMATGGYINTPKVNAGLFTNGPILVNPILTNGVNYGNAFSSPGSASQSEQFGSGAIATAQDALAIGFGSAAVGTNSIAIGATAAASALNNIAIGLNATSTASGAIAFGEGAEADGTNSVVLGSESLATHQNSVVIGNGATSTASNQIMLGSSAQDVVVNHVLSVGDSATNLVLTGATTNKGSVSFFATNNSALANGNNASVNIADKVYVSVSGPTAAFGICGIAGGYNGRFLFIQNSTGYPMTIVNDSGFDATPGNRIKTGTGADVTLTNNPALALLIYDSTASRWVYKNDLGGAVSSGVATNATLLNSVAGNATLTWTNVGASSNGIRSVIVVGSNIVISNAYDTNIYATYSQFSNATNSYTNFALLNGTNTFTGPSNTFNGPLALGTNAVIQSVPVSGATKVYVNSQLSGNAIALCVGPTNNSIASVVALEDSDDPSASIIYRAGGEHDMHFAIGGGDKLAFRTTGEVIYTGSNIELDDSGNLHITGKLTVDGTTDPPGFLADANTRAGAKARDLLDVPDAVTNIYWIGLIGTNNTHLLLSNEVFTTVIKTNDLSRTATYTNKVNTRLVTFLGNHPNAFNGLIARTNVQPSKLTGMFFYDLDAIPRLEMYRASDDTYWTVAGLQITNSLPTTNQVISAMQSIIAAKQAKAALTQ